MAEKLWFSLQSMGQMQSGFTKEGLLNRYQKPVAELEAAARGEGTVMFMTETGIIQGVVIAAGVGIGMTMTGIMGGREIIVIEAGVAVQVPIMIEAVVGGDMTTSGTGVGVDRLQVPPHLDIALVHGGVCLLGGHSPLGMRVLTGAAMMTGLQPPVVFHHDVDLLILEALPIIIEALMIDIEG